LSYLAGDETCLASTEDGTEAVEALVEVVSAAKLVVAVISPPSGLWWECVAEWPLD
jgi:hypothetical protein